MLFTPFLASGDAPSVGLDTKRERRLTPMPPTGYETLKEGHKRCYIRGIIRLDLRCVKVFICARMWSGGRAFVSNRFARMGGLIDKHALNRVARYGCKYRWSINWSVQVAPV